MPRTVPHLRCGLHGSSCVNEQFVKLSVLKNEWNHNESKKGIKCAECLASCTEMEIQVTRRVEVTLPDGSFAGSRFEFTMEALPTERPRRIVVRGILDLVVSMGGTAGLLVGASLLSFVELIYFFTLRLYGNYKTAKEAEDEKKIPAVSKEIVPVTAENRGFGNPNLDYF